MKLILLLATTTLTTVSLAQTYAAKTFALPCDTVQSAAVSYIQHTGLALSPDLTCNHCFIGITGHLRDPRGHAVSTRTAIRLYIDPSNPGKGAFGNWSLPNGLETTARLYFQQTRSSQENQPSQENQFTCTAHLLFSYTWNAPRFVGAMPANEDSTSRPSNLHLEDEYLEAIAQTILATSPPVQTVSTP